VIQYNILYDYRSKMIYAVIYSQANDNMLVHVYKCFTIIYYDLTLVGNLF